MIHDLITFGRENMDLYARDMGAEFKGVTGFDATFGGRLANIAVGPRGLGLTSIAYTAFGHDLIGEFALRSTRTMEL